MLRRRPGEPIKKWSALGLCGMIVSSAGDIIFLPRLRMNDAQVIQHRSQKKKQLIARRRNQVQG